jgi:hypothetical protein
MFSDIIEKLSTFADHHQVMFASIIALAFICFSWGVEKVLEMHLFPKNPVYGYLTAITGSLFLLWFTHHYILHVI